MRSTQKIIVCVILLSFSLASSAILPNSDWVYYAESSKSGFEIYFSKSSVKKDGDFVTVTIVKNFAEPQEFKAEKPYFKFLSSVETQSIDCPKRIYRNARTEKWTELWGKGSLKKAYDYDANKPNAWSNQIKDTQIEGALMAKVCI